MVRKTVPTPLLPIIPNMDDHLPLLAAEHQEPRTDQLLLIVVGAHLRAELHDRPLTDRLLQAIRARGPARLRPVVCTDVWYLNAPELHARPVIAVGDPSVNAATAYLSNRLPTALLIEDSLRI